MSNEQMSQVESFDDPTPIELPTQGANESSQSAGNQSSDVDTFDNMEVKTLEDSQAEEQKQDTKDDKGKAEAEAQPLKDKAINQLEDSEATEKEAKKDGEGAEKDDSEGTEKSDEKDGADKAESSDEKGDGAKSKVKAIKGRLGDEKVALDPNTELTIKVNGKNEKMPLQEILNKASGQIHVDRELTNIDKMKKEFDDHKHQLEGEVDFLRGHLEKVGGMLDDKEGNPLDAMLYLLDVTGRNPLEYHRRFLEGQVDLLEDLADMDDSERKAYWLERENEYLTKRHESLDEKAKSNQQQEQLVAEANRLREAQGVSEDQYVETYHSLKDLGYEDKDLTIEMVVEVAAIKPFAEVADRLLTPYLEELDEDQYNELATEISVNLKSDSISEEEYAQILKEEFGDDLDEAVDLNRKASVKTEVETKSSSKVHGIKEDQLDTFDNYESNMW
jgi:hypothetical protein